MIRISPQAVKALEDRSLQRNLEKALSHTVASREAALREVENWEELQDHARRVKLHTLSRLGDYLERLEAQVRAVGGRVEWARDGREATLIISRLLSERGIATVLKSKSMTGEEIDLNQALEAAGVAPVETDLGEYIVQIAGQKPSHIIAPALHFSRDEVGRLFAKRLGMPLTDDVERITATARGVLRRHFQEAEAGISGVNFAVAENGSLVVVENEGNARLSTSAPQLHIALMGLEKVIPRWLDLSVFLKLLIRSATGQKMTSYVNFLNGPRRQGEVDGPEELVLILLDNGRSRILRDQPLRETLACLRCGACQNVCPVYRKIGGHAYGSTYQGPIGAILTPQLLSWGQAPEHPFASSLCGACQDVCPVKIEIPRILIELRRRSRVAKAPSASPGEGALKRRAFAVWARVMSRPGSYERWCRWVRFWMGFGATRRALVRCVPPLRAWEKHHQGFGLAPQSFREESGLNRRGLRGRRGLLGRSS